jgi:hypothetical protein
VFGHIGAAPGKFPSMAWTWTSMTGGALLSVFWARETVEQDERSTAQHKSRQTGLKGI